MTSKLLIIILSSLFGAALLLSGTYIIIDNIIKPQGYLFEGIVLSGIGSILVLMVMIGISIGNTIMIFGNILTQQAEIQKEMREMTAKAASRPGNISSILSNLIPGIQDGTTSISITDLSTGESTGNGKLPFDLNSIKEKLKKTQDEIKSDIHNMNIEELEAELSKAVKKDDFERAERISQAIKLLKGDSGPEENN